MKNTSRLLASLSLGAAAAMMAATLTTGNLGAKAGANLDQCENGGTSTANPRPCTDTALAWANGNANEGNAHWYEGDSIPYRLRMSGLSTGSHSVTIKWDTTKSGKHALDYLTSYDRSYKPSETGEWNPCDASVTGSLCSPTSFSAWPIPNDTKTGLTADAAQPSVTGRWDQAFKLFGGTITGVSAYSYTVPDYSGDSSASITITFTASKSDAVLAWGGHIANHTDWPNRSAVDITGSPFHMGLVGLDGSGGSQDRSSSSSSVTFPAILTITKNVLHNNGTGYYDGTQSFTFGTTLPSPNNAFTVWNDNYSNPAKNQQQFSTTTFGTPVTITEVANASFIPTPAINCTGTLNGANVNVAPVYSSLGATVTPAEGVLINCTFTNKEYPSTLTVVKHVNNDNGGLSLAAAFKMHITGPGTPLSFDGSELPGTVNALAPGTYTVSEDLISGYTQTGFSGDCNASGVVTLSAGDHKTCTITNDDKAAHLTLVENVVKNNGGTAVAGDFTLTATGSTTISGTGGATQDVNAGTYTLSESGPAGYDASAWSCTGGAQSGNQITLSVGQSVTCTITNTDKTTHLKLVKNVIKNNGGTAVAGDFTLTATGPTTISGLGGAESNVNAGTYDLSESGPTGYDASAWSCTGGGTQSGSAITLALGESVTCTITNDDQAAHLSVTTVVVGGPATPADFAMSVTGGHVAPSASFPGTDAGMSLTLDAGSFGVGENSQIGYVTTMTAGCSGTLSSGGSAICVVTNTYGKAHPTSLSTMSWVLHDSLAVTGIRSGAPNAADAKITFKLYGPDDSTCGGTVINGNGSGEVLSVANGGAATVIGFNLGQLALQDKKGTYRWIAEYSGDDYNFGTVTACGDETHTITVGEPPAQP